MIEQRLFTEQQIGFTSDDYYTPKWVFDALGLHFDLDVASPPGGTDVPCNHYFTQADDGLAQDWFGRVWCNPPFSGASKWVEKWIEHQNGVLLVQSSKAKYFNWLWESNAKCVSTDHKFLFATPGQGGRRDVYMPILIWALGNKNIQALNNIGKVR